MVTIRAAILRRGGMVIRTGLMGSMFDVMSRPATILPQAKRLIGLISSALFSLIGERGLNRG